MDKITLRKQMLEKRLSADKSIRSDADNIIIDKIIAEFLYAETYYLYNSIKGEVDISRLALQLLDINKTVYMPTATDDELIFRRYNKADRLVAGKFNIPEPIGEVCDVDTGVIIIPALAYGLNFYRLGYGKGYYDRYLSKCKRLIKLGVCYDFQVLNSVPFNDFDVPVDFIVTQSRILRRKKR